MIHPPDRLPPWLAGRIGPAAPADPPDALGAPRAAIAPPRTADEALAASGLQVDGRGEVMLYTAADLATWKRTAAAMRALLTPAQALCAHGTCTRVVDAALPWCLPHLEAHLASLPPREAAPLAARARLHRHAQLTPDRQLCAGLTPQGFGCLAEVSALDRFCTAHRPGADNPRQLSPWQRWQVEAERTERCTVLAAVGRTLCGGRTSDGWPCSREVRLEDGVCYTHDPDPALRTARRTQHQHERATGARRRLRGPQVVVSATNAGGDLSRAQLGTVLREELALVRALPVSAERGLAIAALVTALLGAGAEMRA